MKIKLEQIRKQRKMTKRQLSKRAGVSIGYLSELEQGKYNNPSAEVICKLCKALRCTPNDLIDCEGENEK